MTSEDRLRQLIAFARKRAAMVGTMSGLWDIIFDAETFLEGGMPILKHETAAEWCTELEEALRM